MANIDEKRLQDLRHIVIEVLETEDGHQQVRSNAMLLLLMGIGCLGLSYVGANLSLFSTFILGALLNMGTELVGAIFIFTLLRYARRLQASGRVICFASVCILALLLFFIASYASDFDGNTWQFIEKCFLNFSVEMIGSLIVVHYLENVLLAMKKRRQKWRQLKEWVEAVG